MRNFLIDTDTASDDAVAIIMALSAADVSVLALTTVAGNVGVEQATPVLSDAEIVAIEALGTKKARFAIRSNSRAREAYRVQTGEVGLNLADPTAMAVALQRSVGLAWSRHRVAIECSSELTRGMTVVDRLGVNSDPINADVWAAAAGESAGADILWTFDSAKFKSMLTAALAA